MTTLAQKQAFIQLALNCNALKFGNFQLKSGRESPYFFNLGAIYDGNGLHELGHFFAHLFIQNGLNATHLYGPAYKGIPLVTATAIALAERGVATTISYNRKEPKDHGEGGQLVGSPLQAGNTVMIDDVITAGTAFYESEKKIKEQGGQLTGVLIALDRLEPGLNNRRTLQEIQAQGIQVAAIITTEDIIDYLLSIQELEKAQKLRDYLDSIWN